MWGNTSVLPHLCGESILKSMLAIVRVVLILRKYVSSGSPALMSSQSLQFGTDFNISTQKLSLSRFTNCFSENPPLDAEEECNQCNFTFQVKIRKLTSNEIMQNNFNPEIFFTPVHKLLLRTAPIAMLIIRSVENKDFNLKLFPRNGNKGDIQFQQQYSSRNLLVLRVMVVLVEIKVMVCMTFSIALLSWSQEVYLRSLRWQYT